MPIYEYQCSHCRYYLEVMQKITDAKLKKCPSCGRNTLQKLMSAPVFRLKGSGWYETDFKSDQEQRRNLAGAEKEPPAAEAPSKDKDSKDGKDSKEGAAKDAKDTKDTKDTKESSKEAKDTPSVKPAATKGSTAASRAPAKAGRTPARGKSGARRPAARRGGSGKPRRGGRR